MIHLKVWFNLEGNIQIRKNRKNLSTDWCGVRYRRHQISVKKLHFDFVNRFGNSTTEAYRGLMNAFVTSKKPVIKKMRPDDDDFQLLI